jgi:hypothetical protein
MSVSTLARPPAAAVRRFRAGQVGDDTVRTYLAKGWSLTVCCKTCPRLVEWPPPELARRFGGTPDLRIANLVPRLACVGDEGCGSRDVAVFPHLYDGDWRWPPG